MGDGTGRTVPRSLVPDGIVAMGRSLVLSLAVLASAGLLFVLAGAALLLGAAVVNLNRTGHGSWSAAVLVAGLVGWLCLGLLVLVAIRPVANAVRSLSGTWHGMPVSEPYRPMPAGRQLVSRARTVINDPASWRDLLWAVLNLGVGVFLVVIPAVVTGVGLIAFLGSRVLRTIPPPAYPGNTTVSIIIAGVLLTGAGLVVAPHFLRAYGTFSGRLLASPESAELARRVRQLARSRAEALDAGAAEVRRIERDLHDGAQARLVAMGMTLDAAGQLIHQNPEAAQALLIEARENSIKALRELRDLVRGIHPPVLADRGLTDALRALALDTAVSTKVASDLGARPPAPVESAAYFAVSELLANVAKHAAATRTWIDVRYAAGTLRISVTDDGGGGAEPAHGSGLRGVERRIAAFDGVLAVSSPPGGPTVVTLEIPCELQ